MGFFRFLIGMFGILLLLAGISSFLFISFMFAVFGGGFLGVIIMIVWFVIAIAMIYFGFVAK